MTILKMAGTRNIGFATTPLLLHYIRMGYPWKELMRVHYLRQVLLKNSGHVYLATPSLSVPGNRACQI